VLRNDDLYKMNSSHGYGFPVMPKNRFIKHLLFWIGLYVLDVLVFGVGYHNLNNFIKIALLEMPGQLLFAYAVMYFILPRHFVRKKMIETVGMVTLVFLVGGFIGHILFIQFNAYTTPTTLWDLSKICLRGSYGLLKACIFIVFKLLAMWYEQEKHVNEIQKTKLASELKMLRDQVNPHFLFNTLNNLYGLISKNPLHAQESVLGLSRILHFMLHESNNDSILLKKEMNCVYDYIELERLRYPGNLSISVNVHPGVERLSITPLAVFPFVENAFKHGASESITDAWINIDLSTYRNFFVFKIENSKGELAKHPYSHGIGLSNVKRRLELIYGKDHDLHILDSEESYLVVLKIALSRLNQNVPKEYEVEVSDR
jgi:two-component system, LytTR family, sensor kinase